MIILVSIVSVAFVLAAQRAQRRPRRRRAGCARRPGRCGATATCSCSVSAFLLLETKNVTGFALLFGTTWLVNAFVFAGVLLAVLARRRAHRANTARHRCR